MCEAEATQEFDFDIPGIEEVLAREAEGLHRVPGLVAGDFPGRLGRRLGRAATCTGRERLAGAQRRARPSLRPEPAARVCFPVRDFEGRLTGCTGAPPIREMEPRYRMYTSRRQEQPDRLARRVLGRSEQADRRGGRPVRPDQRHARLRQRRDAAVRHAVSYEKLMRMADALEWVTMFDRGAGGDNGRERVDARRSAAITSSTTCIRRKAAKTQEKWTSTSWLKLLSPFVPINCTFSLI